MGTEETPGAVPSREDPSPVDSSEPSPPRAPETKSEGVKLIGGLVVVCAGLVVLMVIAVVAIWVVRDNESEVVALATAAFSVIGTVVGAYFGLKIGSDGTQAAVAGMRDEASKAQAFAAHVPSQNAEAAVASAAGLAPGSSDPTPAATPRGSAPDRPGPSAPDR